MSDALTHAEARVLEMLRADHGAPYTVRNVVDFLHGLSPSGARGALHRLVDLGLVEQRDIRPRLLPRRR